MASPKEDKAEFKRDIIHELVQKDRVGCTLLIATPPGNCADIKFFLRKTFSNDYPLENN